MEQPSNDSSDLVAFVIALGVAMSAAGEPVYLVQDRLTTIANAYGASSATVTVFPTYLMLTIGRGEPAAIALTTTLDGSPRLDQIADMEVLLKLAERGAIDPSDGLQQLTEIRERIPRFGRIRSVVGYAIFATGICLVLHSAASEVAAAALFGAVIGVLRWLARGQQTITVMMPVIAAFTVSALCSLAIEHEVSNLGMRPMVAALVVFLPGAALTTAVLELAAGQMISGASRLVAGGVQLALLAFGILAGIEAVGVPRTSVFFATDALLGEWSPWVGVLVFAVGVVIADGAPRRALPSLLVVLYAAWGSQVVANEMLGVYVAALIGATVMTITAYAMERFPSSMPGQAAFLPGFWLLVPGALGLIGLARFAGGGGAQELFATTGSIFAVALGVLCGTQLLAWVVTTGRVIDRATMTMTQRSPWFNRLHPNRTPDSSPDGGDGAHGADGAAGNP